MNKQNIIAFAGGLLAVVATAYLIVMITTVSSKPKNDLSSQFVNEQTVSDIREKTSSLNAYGDLPVGLNTGDIGKNDPFSNY